MNVKVLSRKSLSGTGKYDKCPYCVATAIKTGKDISEIKSLWKIVTAEPIYKDDGTFFNYIDSHYECPHCHRNDITLDTFREFYTCRFDGTKWSETPKETTIWSKSKRAYVKASWDSSLNKFVEVD